MSKFSIFSHKPDGYSRGSGENFRLDLTGDSNLVDEMVEHLRESGHNIVDVWEYDNQSRIEQKLKGGSQSTRQR